MRCHSGPVAGEDAEGQLPELASEEVLDHDEGDRSRRIRIAAAIEFPEQTRAAGISSSELGLEVRDAAGEDMHHKLDVLGMDSTSLKYYEIHKK